MAQKPQQAVRKPKFGSGNVDMQKTGCNFMEINTIKYKGVRETWNEK